MPLRGGVEAGEDEGAATDRQRGPGTEAVQQAAGAARVDKATTDRFLAALASKGRSDNYMVIVRMYLAAWCVALAGHDLRSLGGTHGL